MPCGIEIPARKKLKRDTDIKKIFRVRKKYNQNVFEIRKKYGKNK